MPAVELPALTYGDATSPRTALLLHGLGSSAATNFAIAEALASSGWSVTSVDLRGHGDAPRADSYRLSDYRDDVLSLPSAGPWDVVIGHSLGGVTAILAAASDPHWARRLILLDPAVRLSAKAIASVRAAVLGDIDAGARGEIVAANRPWSPRDIDEKQSAVLRADRAAVAATMDQNADWNAVVELSELTIPVLVIAADPENGALFTAKHTRKYQRPGVEVVVIPGAGHSVHRDKPAETLAIIREWLNTPPL